MCGSEAGCPHLDCSYCDLVARMVRVMNVLLMQPVITRGIPGCSKTHNLLVKWQRMMYGSTKKKTLLIYESKLRKLLRYNSHKEKQIEDYITEYVEDLLNVVKRFAVLRRSCFHLELINASRFQERKKKGRDSKTKCVSLQE